MEKKQGFKEHSHTADIELEVWATDLNGLFRYAAEGMATISRLDLDLSTKERTELNITAPDCEGLLIRFLSELLFMIDHERKGFVEMNLTIDANELVGSLETVPVIQIGREIKAVTWHNLQIEGYENGYCVRIVFDV